MKNLREQHRGGLAPRIWVGTAGPVDRQQMIFSSDEFDLFLWWMNFRFAFCRLTSFFSSKNKNAGTSSSQSSTLYPRSYGWLFVVDDLLILKTHGVGGGGRRRREGRRRRRRPLPSNVKEIRGNCASPAAPAGWRTLTRSQSTWTTTTTTTHRRTLCECRVLCKKKQKKQLKKKLKIRWWKKKNDGRSWAKRKEKKRTNDVKSLCVLHESNNLPPKSDGIAKDLR
jgi:hypothetical protein